METTQQDRATAAAQDAASIVQEKGLVRAPSATVAARDQFDPRQVGLLKDLAKGAPEPIFNQFLELCARYRLDPFMRHVWLAKMRGDTGDSGGWVVMVGRDGLLSHANDKPDFQGMETGVVYSTDTFRQWYEEDGTPRVEYEAKWIEAIGDDGKAVIEDGAPLKTRGKIIGAYCIVHRTDRIPTYWFAFYDQYVPKSEAKLTRSPWSQYDDSMIAKCAQTTALRLAYSISGFVVAEEVGMRAPDRGSVVETRTETIDWGEDASLAAWLPMLFSAANELETGKWLPRRVALMMRGKSDADRETIAAEVVTWIREHGGTVPERPDVIVVEPEDDHEPGDDPADDEVFEGAVEPEDGEPREGELRIDDPESEV